MSKLKADLENLPSRSVRKGKILLGKGQQTENIFYVEKGCLRSYIIDSKGKEHIYQFAPEDYFISDEDAVMLQTPATLWIDAVEDSEIKILKRPSSQDVDKDSAVEMTHLLERKIHTLRKRILQLLGSSAEERYEEFLKIYPTLAQRLPQKMIASYLGITPESLSRVRKDITRK
ncbi:MAG TPA: Crp/Fnr family transcriptional regulator [Cytophagaceae bacterium]